MKYRLTALITLPVLVLASCSLSEDITPPPGYQSPTIGPTLAATTQPSQTAIPATATPESFAIPTLPATPGSVGSATPASAAGVISGNLTNGSGGAIPDGQKVTLEGFDKDQSGSYQNSMELVAPVESDGSYSFKNVEMPQERAFLIITSWEGVEYQSEPMVVSGTTTNYSIPITIFDKTDDFKILSFNQIHLILDQSSQNEIQVTELFIVANPGKQVVVVASDGTSIPFIQVPKNASGLQYQLSQGSTQLLNATGGFAMVPGADKQFGFIASYVLPYKNGLKFEQAFAVPVASLTVFVPEGMRLRGEQLTDAGKQDIQGKFYQMYQVSKIASDGTLSMSLSGTPGASGSAPSRQTWVLIGIAAAGLLFIGLGILLYLRDRARLRLAVESNAVEIKEDAIGEDRDGIMDAVIALDDQYKAGEIPKEAYEKRRNELKERLKKVL
jgi:hypothetical protein